MRKTTLAAIVAALALIAVGLWFDEPTAAMMNAVMLCLSCMGVG